MSEETASHLHNPLARVGPEDLSHLLAAVQDVTGRLESSHTQLLARVDALTRDLTEANAQLERSRRLAALGEMAAGIAHEIRNPLGCVRLYASMLSQDLSDRPAQAAIAGKITNAARTMEGIVADVLTFSREFQLRSQAVNASDLLDLALEQCCHDGVPGWKGVAIDRRDHAAGGEPVVLEADQSLLTQAVANIVRNAFEAMADSPAQPDRPHRLSLDASVRQVPDGAGRLIRFASLTIGDTGPGVTDEIVARMFNPFFTTRHTGTGLGLAIVHRIADAHGGHVRVFNNADGPGASVELVIPLHAADNAAVMSPSPARPRTAGQPIQSEQAA